VLPDALKAMIDDAEVVSFDVFDTLLSRRHYSPADVFSAASGPRSRLTRIAAERIARIVHRHQEDVTLAQIYAFLRMSPDAELAAEKATLFPNPEAREIYDYALAGGKRIIAASDMYLPGNLVSELLRAAGYRDVERVYLSCEAGMTKAGGRLFRHVVQDMGVRAETIVHIGDHAISDCARPREQGLRSYHLPSARMRFEQRKAVHPKIVRALRRGRKPSHSLLLGLMRDGLADWNGDYWYALGFAVAGPIVNAFADWIRRRYVDGRHDGAFLFARDGFLPLEVLKIRHPEIAATYTFASRRMLLIPALETLQQSTLNALTTSLPGTTAEEHWTRLGIDNPAVEALLARHFKPGERVWPPFGRLRLEAFFREAHPLFLPDVQREKAAVRDYLESIGFLGVSSRPLIVDVGWNASSQRFLEIAFPELAGTPGAYFGLKPAAYDNGHMRAFFFERGRPARMYAMAFQCVEIAELLFSAPHPPIQTIGDDRQPVFEALTPDEERRIALVRAIHDGALAFTRRLAELEKTHPVALTRDDVALLLAPIVLEPTPQDIEHLGRLPHALGLGTSRYETLLPATIDPSPIALLRHHLAKPRHRLYWPQGVLHTIRNEHGALRGLGARAAISVSLLAINTWDRILRMFGK